ncbi:hypothetical protein L6164_035764 [Bauhinia variegata]|uniref:Uncharacterized protein n=1 Tax=Bauhinia variegata TaxID=167791 RepID=A0ACB9KEZ5_BAUVA|nr:hypothetical protein L6164_035764 [Bauhinia variegata]
MVLVLAPAVCVGTHMQSSGSTGLCVADNASVAMPRKLASLSTAEGLIRLPHQLQHQHDLGLFKNLRICLPFIVNHQT